MNAIRVLKDDHRTIKKLFTQFEGLGERASRTRQQVVARIIQELSAHAVVEEQLLYPAMRARGGELEDMALEALEEHHVAKWVLHELSKLTPQDERFDAKTKVLIESVRHHMEEEEESAFPRFQEAFDRQELEVLGQAMIEARKLAPTRPHPRSPQQPPANLVAGVIASMMDRSLDLVKGARRAPRALAARALRGAPPSRRGGRGKRPRGRGGRGEKK